MGSILGSGSQSQNSRPQMGRSSTWRSLGWALLVLGGAAAAVIPVVSVSSTNAQENATPLAKPELLGKSRIEGNTHDLTGLKGAMTETVDCDQFGGISALSSLGDPYHFLALSDRGPDDGAVRWQCRMHEMKLVHNGNQWKMELQQSLLLRDDGGHPYSGSAEDIQATETLGHRLDPEGIQLLANGHVIISDEYGPDVLEVDRKGNTVAQWPVPEKFRVSHPAATKLEENKGNAVGRASNRGFEGMVVIPDVDPPTLLLSLQSPLIQDSRVLPENGWCLGQNVRLLQMQKTGSENHEYVYVMDSDEMVLSELLAVDSQRFLVIERDEKAGELAAKKWVTMMSLEGASDVSGIASLKGDLPSHIKPVQKRIVIDLLDPQYGLAGADFPQKLEGLAWGPKLEDGRRMLIIATDNDYVTSQATQFFYFAIDMDQFK